MKILELTILIAVLIGTVGLEWGILKHAGMLWALIFGWFVLPWAVFAALALLPHSRLRWER